eukprot:Phypoly_transcript_09063.p1 GENE.Phypoly_transcript_09063~~Phypoly_transcript_09063.p1  ORF type:complete len:445 (+),score=44.18 Phypoly_transcript_09063:85-1335(+)
MNLIIPWLWGFPLALITAELACSMPEDGGCVVWGSKAFGRFYGWLIGWICFFASTFDTSIYPVLFASYLSQTLQIKFPFYLNWGISAFVVLFIACVNIYGADLVGVASYIFGIIVLAPFLIMFGLAAKDLNFEELSAHEGVPIQWAALLSLVLWTSSGWDDVGQLAGEIKEPAKNFPRAMIVTMLIVIIMYILPLAAGISIDPNYENWNQNGYFSVAAAKVGGDKLRIFLGVGGMMSSLGLFNCLLCASARLVYCLSTKGYIPKFLSTLTPKRDTPICAILFNSLLVALLGSFSFTVLVELDFLLYSLTIMLEYAAWMKLRISRPEMERPYRLPFSQGPMRIVSGIVLILAPLGLTIFNFYCANWISQVAVVGVVAVGIVLYFLVTSVADFWEKRKGALPTFSASIQDDERTVLLK